MNISSVQIYCAIIKVRIASLLQFRASTFSGLLGLLFWGILNTSVACAFYASSPESAPISLPQIVTLIWLGQLLIQLLPWVIDPEIEHQVKTGTVSYEMVRPLDLYWTYFSRSFAFRLAPMLCLSPVLFLIAYIFCGLAAPISWVSGFVFSVSLCFASLLSASIGTLVIISLFWTTCGAGVQRILPHASLFLSGVALPLPLYPSWAQGFLSAQPLRGIIDIPARIYTGVIPENAAAWYIGFQIAWIVVLILFGRFLLGKAVKRFVVQGG